MHQSNIKPFYRIAAIAAAALSLAGCSGNKPAVDETARAATLQQSIEAIKNNPHIPDQAKAQIIASMQQGRGMGAQQ